MTECPHIRRATFAGLVTDPEQGLMIRLGEGASNHYSSPRQIPQFGARGGRPSSLALEAAFSWLAIHLECSVEIRLSVRSTSSLRASKSLMSA